MADLIAIGYDDEETAGRAAEEVYLLEKDLIIEPDAVAVIVRDENGKYKVTTNHHPVAEGVSWGMLFGLFFFVPIFGLALGGAFGALFGTLEKVGMDKHFQQEVREMVRPGTSALFLIVEKMTTDKALAALSKYGGTVLKTSLSEDAEQQLQSALSGKGRQPAAPADAVGAVSHA